MKYYCDTKRHLICEPYSIENLHKMAVELKINVCWFHGGKYPHYDIPLNKKEYIESICEVISSKELLLRIKKDLHFCKP